MALLIGSLFTVSLSLIALPTLPDLSQLLGRQEDFMHQLLDRFRGWRAGALLASATLCESCGHVCTAACRRDAQMERVRFTSQRLGLPRF